MKSETYKLLANKLMTQYSHGKINFSQLKKKLQRLNRRILPIILMFVCVAAFGYAESSEWIEVQEDPTFLAMMPNGQQTFIEQVGRTVDTIIIHHTNGSDVDTPASAIDEYHKSIGWECIGYHYVIRRNGDVEFGRPDEKIGAHAKGRNATSLGIALSGNTATQKQIEALYLLCRMLRDKYPITSIERHHEECPGKSVPVEDLANALLGRQ